MQHRLCNIDIYILVQHHLEGHLLAKTLLEYRKKSSRSFEYAKSVCNKYINECDIIVEIIRDGQSIFELGKMDSFNGCPELRQTQAEMGIKLK